MELREEGRSLRERRHMYKNDGHELNNLKTCERHAKSKQKNATVKGEQYTHTVCA